MTAGMSQHEFQNYLELLARLLRIRKGQREAIADELWRFVLFSEFVFDLPGPLPMALADVPMADSSARLQVETLCDRIRNDRRCQAVYIERAEAVENDHYHNFPSLYVSSLITVPEGE